MPSAVIGLLRACHPEPTAAVTIMTTAFAVATGRGTAGAFWVGAAVLAGQLSVGWSNDYVDRDRDVVARRPDKPIAAGVVAARTVGVAAAVALLGATALSFASGWRAATAHLVGVAAGWSYNLGVKSTAASVVPYLAAFGAAPAFVVLGLPGHPLPPAWLVAAGGLLGAGAHFVNVLPDLDDDLRTGVRGLPHRLGRRASMASAVVSLAGASAILAVAPAGGVDALGVGVLVVTCGLLGVALLAGRRTGSRAAFRIALLIAILDVALLITRGSAVADAS